MATRSDPQTAVEQAVEAYHRRLLAQLPRTLPIGPPRPHTGDGAADYLETLIARLPAGLLTRRP